jgi:hypothetical protein
VSATRVALLGLVALAVDVALALGGAIEAQQAGRVAAAILVAAVFALGIGRLPSSRSLERAFDASGMGDAGAPERPIRLDQLDRMLRFCSTEGDVQFRLRPVLRDVAAGLLRERHGLDLDGEPVRAEQLLGPELAALVRADRPAPPDRSARTSLDDHALLVLVERLGAL